MGTQQAALVAVLFLHGFAASGADEYSHRLWRIEDGLPQNRIRALCQTGDGYLWIGTAEGLAQFDGTRFTIFDQSNTPALHDDGILALRVTRDGALWIGTEGGGLVRYQGGLFRSFGGDEGLTNGFVRAIHEDRRRNLWVGTDRGFFRLAGERFAQLDHTAEVPLASVSAIGEDDAGRIWVAAAAGLLSVEEGVLRAHAECAAFSVRSLERSREGSLRAIGNRGAGRLRNGCLAPDPELPGVPMRSLLEDGGGSLWIGTMGQGLLRSRGGRTAHAKITLEEARQAVWNLRHPEAEESSITMLLELARKLGREHGIEIAAEMAGNAPLDAETDRTILLVGREALRNAVAHSQAGHISVRIECDAAEVGLEVADDGAGFAADPADGQNRHFGITGMRERVEKMGGVSSVISRPGEGTRVRARIPLPARGAEASTTRRSPAGAR